MIISGIKPTSNGGEVIPCTPETKVKAAVTAAASGNWDGYHTYVSDVLIEELTTNMAGDKFKKKFDNNRYTASGTVTVGRRDLKTDLLMNPTKVEYSISFNDCLDENGLPDIKVDKAAFAHLS